MASLSLSTVKYTTALSENISIRKSKQPNSGKDSGIIVFWSSSRYRLNFMEVHSTWANSCSKSIKKLEYCPWTLFNYLSDWLVYLSIQNWLFLKLEHNWAFWTTDSSEISIASFSKGPANIYFSKINTRNTRKSCGICPEFTIKIPERRQWRLSGVFIVNFEHISCHLLEFIVDFEHAFVCLWITVLKFRKIPRKTFVRNLNYAKKNLLRMFIKEIFKIFGTEADWLRTLVSVSYYMDCWPTFKWCSFSF